MTVITISKEFGSEGTQIGRQVAQTLGYQYVNRLTIEAVLQQYGFVQFNELYQSAPGFWARSDQNNLLLISMLNKTLLTLAQRGRVVILGRGGFVALNGFADVLNVRIQAPFPIRVKRVMERENLTDPQKGEELVNQHDRIQRAFIQAFYDTRWDATNAFNLVLDTGSIPLDMAVTWITQAAHTLEESLLEKSATTQSIQVDPVLAEAVANVLMPVS
jgi:cytidylate kinase